MSSALISNSREHPLIVRHKGTQIVPQRAFSDFSTENLALILGREGVGKSLDGRLTLDLKKNMGKLQSSAAHDTSGDSAVSQQRRLWELIEKEVTAS